MKKEAWTISLPNDATQTVTHRLDRRKPNEPEGRRPEPTLIVIAHPLREVLGSRVELVEQDEVSLGRGPEAEVFLGDVSSLSRLHAAIAWQVDEVTIRDLGSTNGTFVNDLRIEEPVALRNGDRIQLGAVHLKFLRQPDVERAYHEAMYELAWTDGLTDLANRRRFEEELPRELARSSRYERPFSLILIDIDRFKAINDTFGHVAGDMVLKRIAQLCAREARREQCVARLGGDEFAILCPETSAEGATVYARRIRDRLAEIPFEWDGQPMEVSVSIGLAEAAGDVGTAREVYAAADRALYRAKGEGRDRISL